MDEVKNSEVVSNDKEKGNNLKLHPLQSAAMFGMMILVLISFSVANLQSVFWITSNWLVSTILPAVVTEATNSARAEEGIVPLSRNPQLDEAARLKAEDMAQKNYFSHWSPDGVSPWYWFEEAGYSYLHAGENLAVHFTDSSAVVEAWLRSPTHRDNILNSKYTEIGIGTARGEYEGYDTVFVVQMFGSPASSISTSEAGVIPPVAEEADSVFIAPPQSTTTETENVTEADANPPVAVAGITKDSDTKVSVTNEGTVVYESYAATVAENAEEIISAPTGNITSSPSTFARVLTSPRLLLQFVYFALGLLVIMSLITSIVIEWRRHHPVQIAYATAMLLIMMVLFQLHIYASGGALIA